MLSIVDFLRRKINEAAFQFNCVDNKVTIGNNCYISGSTLVGDVRVGDFGKIYRAHIEGSVVIGRFTSLWGPGISVIGRLHGIRIGNFCSVAKNVSLQEDFHDYRRTTTYFIERNLFGDGSEGDSMLSKGIIHVGSDVWIGGGAQILSGVSVGHGAVIGAGAVVTKDVKPYAVVVGNPARQVRYRFRKEIVDELLASNWWDWPEEKLRTSRSFLTRYHGE